MRPLFSFYGSKWMAARRYPAPRSDGLVVEPFAGSAGYSLYHMPARVQLYDIDPIIVGVWDYLIRVSPEEVLALPDLRAGQVIDDLPLPQEARWLIGFWAQRGAAAPAKRPSPWQIQYQSSVNNQLVWSRRARERIARDITGIRHWRVEQRSFADVPTECATWFVDPPYSVKGGRYRFSEVDYAALAAWCQDLPGTVIVCEQEGADWMPFAPFGTFKSTRGKATEVAYIRECDGVAA